METLLNHLSQSLTENPLLAYLGVFLGGILSSSSPCVLATIPLVIGYVGGYSEGDRRRALLYSLTFILGLSLTFTVLGAIASVIGGLFGMISRTWYFIVGGIAVVIGLQLVGLYEFNLPTPGHLQPKQRGLLGAFILRPHLRHHIIALCHSNISSHPDIRCYKRRGCLRDLVIIRLCSWPLCPDLFGRHSNRLCRRIYRVRQFQKPFFMLCA